MTRKVIGIGETVFDILFKEGQPIAAVPGGSVFNSIISLGRMGVEADFISETGNDRVGQTILSYLRENGVGSTHVNVFPDGKSPVSLAFLDEHNDADYLFYKDYPAQRLEVEFPAIQPDDIVLYGSYFVLNPVLRPKVSEFLQYARSCGALLYYDVNFRATHRNEAIRLTPTILENLEYADIVRGSADDFRHLYGCEDASRIYREKIAFYCPRFVCTHGGDSVALCTPGQPVRTYSVPQVETVSTVGAGDNFNAGLVYGLMRQDIRRAHLATLSPAEWDGIIHSGIDFATEACRHLGNSVPQAFADAYRRR